jgi:hypothetical protein
VVAVVAPVGKHRAVMNIHRHHLMRLVVAAAAATSLAIGAASAAAATTEPPTDTASMGTEAAPPGGGSSAADMVAFCEAEVAVEVAAGSEDPSALGPAIEALAAAAPEDARPLVDAVIANAENTDSPEFAAAYSALIDYLKANCGFAELDVQAQEYAFVGIPEEVPAGPTVVTFENIGEEAHEFALFRINDDVTMTVEELLALPQEEAESMLTEVGGTFALPGQTGYTVIDLTPGRHVALCFIPQGTTMEVIEQMMAAEAAAEGSAPEGSATIDSAHTDGTVPMATEAAGSTPADSSAPAEGTVPAGSVAPEGSVPPGEGPPHFTLGMIQEFTVV